MKISIKCTCNAIPIYFHYNHQLSLLHNCFHQSCGFYNDWNLIMSINVPCSDYAIMKFHCFACIGTVLNFPLLAFNHYNALTHSPKKMCRTIALHKTMITEKVAVLFFQCYFCLMTVTYMYPLGTRQCQI